MPTLHKILGTHSRDIFNRLRHCKDKTIFNLSISHFALLLLTHEKPFIAIEDSPQASSLLFNDLLFFDDVLKGSERKEDPTDDRSLVFFPPGDNPEDVGARAKALLDFKNKTNVCIVTSPEAVKIGFSISHIQDKILTISKGLSIDRNRLNELLSGLGYKKVSLVVERGDFSQREWLFDIFPVTEESPIRVEFFGDQIDLIRTFDVETQRSLRDIEQQSILPVKEGDLNHDLVNELLQHSDIALFCTVTANKYIPLDKEYTLNSDFVSISHLPVAKGSDSDEMPLKGLGILPEERKTLEDIVPLLIRDKTMEIVVLPSMAQSERFKDILFDGGIIAPIVLREKVSSYSGRICITTGDLSSGIHIPGLLVLTDREIFGERPPYRSLRKSKVSRLLLTIDDLAPGDFVVHEDHGIGKFIGVQRQKAGDIEEDLITIEYAHGDRLYMPFQGIQKIQKYSVGEDYVPLLNRLGGKRWQKTKANAKKGIRQMTEKLLKLYAERTVSRGFVFSEDTALHREFDAFFPYEETPDQIRASSEIKKFMHSDKVMDMLLCGDVGYGKTEVAMKAAFRAVYDGKQVAVLVPTTLLAEQHFRTFKTRFSGFPVKIDYLSRFKTKDEIKNCKNALSRGALDIVIGTHMLLSGDVQFFDLGLLILDEEHRFGVNQKEKLKELKKNADVLTLTATPIPRTLHMSLSGIREMSVIETPPEERLAVRSFVTLEDDNTIKEAIERELKREGQIFFVHNRIKDIDIISDHLKGLVPKARITSAHGQMKEAELEKIMINFLNKNVDVLVSTSIIGSGLDIPSCNTIIIDRSDTFGLSDLYQLRGRVGRGRLQAYAYFLIPGEEIISNEAKKRIKAIQEMSYLGAGFRLALKDLEIRGAGNLLGSEQSGHIYKVGFDMYTEMLEKTVAELRGQSVVDEVEPQITLRISAFIPEDYIADVTLRLNVYRRLSSIRSIDTLMEVKDELIDRFGKIPETVDHLLNIVRIRLLAKLLFIKKVSGLGGRFRFSFLPDSESNGRIPVDFFDKILKILFSLSVQPRYCDNVRIRFMSDGFRLTMKDTSLNDQLEQIIETLQLLLLEIQGA
ncbi:MAG: transcription-repair coupling factor [Dissulfurispiraceae bacterium]